jgi:hypothetical protein
MPSKVWTELRGQIGRLIVVTVIGLLILFSDTIIGNVKTVMNRFDRRFEVYEERSRALRVHLHHRRNRRVLRGGLDDQAAPRADRGAVRRDDPDAPDS